MKERGPVGEQSGNQDHGQAQIGRPEEPEQQRRSHFFARPVNLVIQVLISRSHPASFPKPGFVSEDLPVS